MIIYRTHNKGLFRFFFYMYLCILNALFLYQIISLYRNLLKLVHESIKGWDTFLKTLSLSDGVDDFEGLGGVVEWVTVDFLPVREHTLWESLTGSKGSQVSSET